LPRRRGEDEVGRRERKRQETRDHIARTARTLFAERGFAAVTVAEIAAAADVSEQTVYNHFPTKEDLVFWRRGTFEAQLLAAIRDRPPGESALAAFARFIAQPRSETPPPDAAPGHDALGGAQVAATIMDSPALQARERAIVAGYTAPLAALLAEDTGTSADAIEPWVVATAMLGVTQALIDHARRRVLAGARQPALTRELRARAQRAVRLLEQGLGGYAVKAAR